MNSEQKAEVAAPVVEQADVRPDIKAALFDILYERFADQVSAKKRLDRMDQQSV